MHIRRNLLTLTLAGLLAGCGGGSGEGGAAPAGPVTPLDTTTVGTIAGVVRFEGTPPPMGTLPLASWPVCAEQHQGPVPTGDVLVRDGLVQNAFVYIKEGLGSRTFPVPTAPVTIDQHGCAYSPRVAGAQVGQPIQFLNSDATLHNVHGSPGQSSGWNFAMATKGSARTIKVDKPEVMVSVRCDLHPWMQGWLGVLAHPHFAVTGADGRFTLKDVPPGEYVVAAWHERFGTREVRLTLSPQGAGKADFTFAPPG